VRNIVYVVSVEVKPLYSATANVLPPAGSTAVRPPQAFARLKDLTAADGHVLLVGARAPARPPACQPARPPARLPASLPACLPACLPRRGACACACALLRPLPPPPCGLWRGAPLAGGHQPQRTSAPAPTSLPCLTSTTTTTTTTTHHLHHHHHHHPPTSHRRRRRSSSTWSGGRRC
jgi:hypothetical protein